MKKLLLPAALVLLAGCTTPSGAPGLPIKPAPVPFRYGDEREDDLDHDLSRYQPVVSSAATA